MCLELLLAFDHCKRIDLLDLAYEVIQKLDNSINKDDTSHINFLQTKIRKHGQLDFTDQQWLFRKIDCTTQEDNPALFCAAHILLREPQKAKNHFKSSL